MMPVEMTKVVERPCDQKNHIQYGRAIAPAIIVPAMVLLMSDIFDLIELRM
jgi:hypothetical protein